MQMKGVPDGQSHDERFFVPGLEDTGEDSPAQPKELFHISMHMLEPRLKETKCIHCE
jgi:hypothetical protein